MDRLKQASVIAAALSVGLSASRPNEFCRINEDRETVAHKKLREKRASKRKQKKKSRGKK